MEHAKDIISVKQPKQGYHHPDHVESVDLWTECVKKDVRFLRNQQIFRLSPSVSFIWLFYVPDFAAQYSSGRSSVVTDRSHSVITQIRSPSDVRYALNRRPPFSSPSSLASQSSLPTSPQSPLAWRTRKSNGGWPDLSSTERAPGVATISPRENLFVICGLGFTECPLEFLPAVG